jgi:intraflagellar transport protein 74
MSELIDSFDRLKAEELHKTQAAQKEIVRLLQTLARKLEHMENPSRLNADRLAEMKSDLDFKQMQMGNSASTSERLGQELERRKQELQKIDTLDEKISVELRQLAERMASMSSELDTYRDLKSLKETSRRRREELSAAKQQAIGRSGGLKEEARRARARHDELSSRLTADALAVELDELEQAMRSHEERVFSSSDFITARSLETKYQPVADDCARFVRTLNQEVVRGLAQQPLMASDGA